MTTTPTTYDAFVQRLSNLSNDLNWSLTCKFRNVDTMVDLISVYASSASRSNFLDATEGLLRESAKAWLVNMETRRCIGLIHDHSHLRTKFETSAIENEMQNKCLNQARDCMETISSILNND